MRGCRALKDEELDAVVRALPDDRRGRVSCALGSPALDDERLKLIDDVAAPAEARGSCWLAVIDRHPSLLQRAFKKASGDRVVVDDVVFYAARETRDDHDPRFAPVLEQAVRDRALRRWDLTEVVCPDFFDYVANDADKTRLQRA